MKFATLILYILLSSVCTAQTINPPKEIRQANYRSTNGWSCGHAVTVLMLHWQGQPAMAVWWRQTYGGPVNFSELAAKAKYAKLDYAVMRGGDTGILDYATATGMGAVVDWSGERGIYRDKFGKERGHHGVFFCGFDRGTASFIDPNTSQKHTFTREAFLAHWRRCGGRSFMTLYSAPKH